VARASPTRSHRLRRVLFYESMPRRLRPNSASDCVKTHLSVFRIKKLRVLRHRHGAISMRLRVCDPPVVGRFGVLTQSGVAAGAARFVAWRFSRLAHRRCTVRMLVSRNRPRGSDNGQVHAPAGAVPRLYSRIFKGERKATGRGRPSALLRRHATRRPSNGVDAASQRSHRAYSRHVTLHSSRATACRPSIIGVNLPRPSKRLQQTWPTAGFRSTAALRPSGNPSLVTSQRSVVATSAPSTARMISSEMKTRLRFWPVTSCRIPAATSRSAGTISR
jgi:hypothetical protein